MVLSNGEINIIADMEGTTGVKLHNNRQKLQARFDIKKKLGQGTYGKVQLAINKDTGEEVAIKTIKKSKIETEQDLIRIQREIQIMSSVQHPHIIHIYEVFENKEKIVLVMEYASGGELYDYLSYKKVLEEPEARRVFRQVASAVYYCHKNMICHRDLKLENILLDERGSAKIADFGLSNVFDDRHFLSTFCGSPLYASPEIVRGTPYYGPEVDCWSLGVLLYTLVYGAMPFDGSNFKKLVRQISEGDYYEPKVPSEASALIRRMLTVDPAKRATIEDICGDLWVDHGEEVPLCDLANDMCKQMPVRLDYLLALTATAPHPPPDLPIPPPTDADDSAATTTTTTTNDADERLKSATPEQVAEQTDDSAIRRDTAADKKHKLAASLSSSVTDAAGAETKKQKTEADVGGDDDADEMSADLFPASVAVVGGDAPTASEAETESMEVEPPTAEEAEEVKEDLPVPEAEATPEIPETEPTAVAAKVTAPIKSTAAAARRSLSAALPKTKSEEATRTGSKVPKIKKTSGVAESASEKRKLSLGSTRIGATASDAIKKPLTSAAAGRAAAAAGGVTSVRKMFESPATTGSRALTARKSSTGGDEERRHRSPESPKKTLVRQNSRKGLPTPPRTTSPTKTTRATSGHNGCIPREALLNAKKSASPPKPGGVVGAGRKSSPEKSNNTKMESGGVVRRGSGSVLASRTRSPVKSIKLTPAATPVAKDEPEVAEVAAPPATPTVSEEDVLTDKLDSVTLIEPPLPVLTEKRGSIEIAPLPPPKQEDVEEEAEVPQIRFVPRDKGQFTLLGVKSEVMFDVGEAEPEAENRKEEEEEKEQLPEESKIERYVATVQRHGEDPDRVTLLGIRKSETEQSVHTEALPVSSFSSSQRRGGGQEVEEEEEESATVKSEQRGYSVYRSKYRTVRKYRSIVERLGDGDEADRSPERSDSFSSNEGSDELEDVFESFTSESLFSSLLSRTRHLMDRITEGDCHATRWFSRPTTTTSFRFYLDTPPPKSRSYYSATGGTLHDAAADSNRIRRWRVSRSTGRKSAEESCSSAPTAAADNSATTRFRFQASFNDRSSDSSLSAAPRRQSRYDTFRAGGAAQEHFSTERRRHQQQEQHDDILSAIFRHRNRSLDGRRPRSLYDDEDGSGVGTLAWQRAASSSSKSSSCRELPEEDVDSLYGTMRRPLTTSRWSMPKDAADGCSGGGGGCRPRSVHGLSAETTPIPPSADDSVSVSRDYSRSTSQSGNTKREEEEEYERRVVEGDTGSCVTTTRRECKRSVSEDEKSSSVRVHTSLRRQLKKHTSGDDDDDDPLLSRQDSGVGSLYETASPPIGGDRRAGAASILKYTRSISNDLESLDEEFARVGLRHNNNNSEQQAEVGGGGGYSTPVSDGADNGSVCSDTSSATATETVKSAAEEESVGERIRRKSFYARFNETAHLPRRKSYRDSGSAGVELSRSSSLRRHHVFEDDIGGGGVRAPTDLYGSSARLPQRWSVYFGSGTGSGAFSDTEHDVVHHPPRRSSLHGSGGAGGGEGMSYYNRPPTECGGATNSGSWYDDGPLPPPGSSTSCGNSSMSRTHSLPEDQSPPSSARPVSRHLSMPGTSGSGYHHHPPPASSSRRPTNLRFYTRHDDAVGDMPSDLMMDTSPLSAEARPATWRTSLMSSSDSRPPRTVPARDSYDPWESSSRPHRRLTSASSTFASIMDSLESPTEVLQKAMELCDSLRHT